jgi:hypothetical protein
MARRYAVLVLGFLGCSPLVRVEVKFEVPGVPVLDPTRLHVRGRVACDSFDLSEPRATPPAAPPPGLEESAAGGPRLAASSVSFDREGTVARASFRATKCHIAISAFYDTDNNGVLGPGDFVATLPAVEVSDRGLCSGNMNDLGTIVLKPM